MDLGAPPRQSLRRVLLPLLGPAILASAALVFADSGDDFVTVRYLSGPASSAIPWRISIRRIAGQHRAPAGDAPGSAGVVLRLVLALGRRAAGRLPVRPLAAGAGTAGPRLHRLRRARAGAVARGRVLLGHVLRELGRGLPLLVSHRDARPG